MNRQNYIEHLKEDWEFHKRNPELILVWVAFIAAIVCAFTGCVTETTRTIVTDKEGTVHDVTVTRKGTDPATLKLVEVAAAIYLPRPAMLVREEKCDHDMARLLRGWQGRQVLAITPDEIRHRWRPTP